MSTWIQKYWKWIALAAVLVAISVAVAFLPVKDWVKAFSDWVQTLGAVGVVLFIAVYALATVLFLPGWIFTVAAGLIYGVDRRNGRRADRSDHRLNARVFVREISRAEARGDRHQRESQVRGDR
jgi:uncharacterized membrane protein